MNDEMPVIRYATGEIARIGDRVDLDGWSVVVEDVIATPEDMARWGHDERGLIFVGEESGTIFQACESVCDNDIVFLGRAD